MEENTPTASQVKKKRVKKKVLKKRVKSEKSEDNGENGGELKGKGDESQAPGSRRGSFSQEKTKVPENQLSKLFN